MHNYFRSFMIIGLAFLLVGCSTTNEDDKTENTENVETIETIEVIKRLFLLYGSGMGVE